MDEQGMPRNVRIGTFFLAASALLLGLQCFLIDPSPYYRFFDVFQQAGFGVPLFGGFVAMLLVFELMRCGGAGLVWGFGALLMGVLLSFALGYAWSPIHGWRGEWPLMAFEVARWLLLLAPLASLGAYQWRSWAFALALLAGIGVIAFSAPSMFIESSIQRGTYQNAWSDFNANTRSIRWTIGASAIILGIAVAIGAWRAPKSLPKTRQQKRFEARPSAFLVSGIVLMMLAWLLGGSVLPSIVPFWMLGLALILTPIVLQAPRARAPAMAAALLFAGGLVPWISCTTTYWTDAGEPPAPDSMHVSLVQLAGHGPWWNEGGGFTGASTRCPEMAVGLAGGWLVALATCSWWSGRTAGPRRRGVATA